jgi:hypothetical protein
MAREKGYVSPLLSNLAVDYSAKVREAMVGPLLFPRVPVGKPSGKYAVFDKENVYKVPDAAMAGERSQANEFASSGKMENYATTPYGLKAFIDKADLEFMDGPFKLWERRKTELLVTKLELAQEKRIADLLTHLEGRTTSLAGVGDAAGNKWAGGKGDPVAAIKNAIAQCFFRPNTMVFNEAVYDALEYHPVLLKYLGEANLIKKVDEANLAKLFRIDRVIIAKGKADFEKRAEDKSVNPQSIWGDSVVLCYTDSQWDQPCAGKTVAVKYAEADGSGYVVRSWDEDDGGMLGGEYVQVAHDVAEIIVCKELVYTINSVL